MDSRPWAAPHGPHAHASWSGRCRVHDPIAAGRRTALRAVAAQALVVVVLAAAFLARDVREALAVGAGGLALVSGNALAALVALGRLLLGTMVKWLVAIVVLATALAIWRLPPLPMLGGLVAGLLAYLLALNFLKQRKNTKG